MIHTAAKVIKLLHLNICYHGLTSLELEIYKRLAKRLNYIPATHKNDFIHNITVIIHTKLQFTYKFLKPLSFVGLYQVY